MVVVTRVRKTSKKGQESRHENFNCGIPVCLGEILVEYVWIDTI